MFPNLRTVVGEGNCGFFKWGELGNSRPFPVPRSPSILQRQASEVPWSRFSSVPPFPCLRATSLRVPCASLRFSQSDVSSDPNAHGSRLSPLRCAALLRGFQTSLFLVFGFYRLLNWIMSAVHWLRKKASDAQ